MEQVAPVLEKIKLLAAELHPGLVAVRRHLHQHPELSFKEFKTSEFLASKLEEAGISFKRGYVKTGIVAVIEGKDPGAATVLLRGDMDALPIEEQNDVPYRSQNKGVMHACGHDVHSTCALGAALILHRLRHEWQGTVKVMFQPGEEVLPGGASLMIEEGVLDGVDKAVALHVFPSMDAGRVGFRPGMYMASTDELRITVNGKAGHAAMPEDYINPLVIAADILLAIEKKFMAKDALKGTPGDNIPTVVAFGRIEGKGATNIIPEKVYLEGTFRTMDENWRSSVHRQLQQIVRDVSRRYGVISEIEILKGYPFLVNDVEFTKACAKTARLVLGENNVDDLPVRMTAEDFAFISQKVSSCFFRLGTDNKARGITSGVHTPTFDADEKALETGAAMMACLAVTANNSTTKREA